MASKAQQGEAERLDERALLYAGGALTEAEAVAFEGRLAEDQQAREALCRAADLLHGAPAEELRPGPAYRARVHTRLHGRSGPLAWLLQRRLYSGHPAVWTGLGAAAAVLVMLLFPWGGAPSAPAGVQAPATPPARQEQRVGPALPAASRAVEEARVWTQLPRSQHLVRAHHEQTQRKERAEKLQRLIQLDEGRARLLGPRPGKN
jgi:hypothetical protein